MTRLNDELVLKRHSIMARRARGLPIDNNGYEKQIATLLKEREILLQQTMYLVQQRDALSTALNLKEKMK